MLLSFAFIALIMFIDDRKVLGMSVILLVNSCGHHEYSRCGPAPAHTCLIVLRLACNRLGMISY